MLTRLTSLLISSAVTIGVASFDASAQDTRKLRGSIRIDGSSTVYPITEAVAESFKKVAPNVKVTVGVSGTGGGFKRFAAKETDISDASRPIKGSEARMCEDAGIDFIEIPVAYDGLTIVVSRENDWVESITVDDLNRAVLRWTREEVPQDPQLVRTAIEVLAIAQRLERIGDLSTSMAEQVIYLVEGRSVRHGQD